MNTENREKPNFHLRTSVKDNLPDETPQNPPVDRESLHTLICLTPMYTDGIVKTEWVRIQCSNTLKKQPWLLRNAFCALAWDKIRGLFFDWRLMMARSKDANKKETIKVMSTDVQLTNDDRQLSIYELLYATQCQAISEFIEMMARDGNMTDEQLDFIQRKLLGGLSDSAKAALVIRAMYGNRKDQFTFADKTNRKPEAF